jgi:hypothetical protein
MALLPFERRGARLIDMGHTLIVEYERTLASLSGNDFQDEICSRLRAVIIDFQAVPAKPQGDAGLDGFSHHGERGYCCYGPEHDAFKRSDARESAIVAKFKGDLRRLFELDLQKRKVQKEKVQKGKVEKGKLEIRENKEIATILPHGAKIKHIELLVNWFESHRILSPILSAVQEYVSLSKCRYVDPKVTVIVIGPKQLANQYGVDELTIVRAQQRVLIQKVQKKAETLTLGNTEKFDKKMSDLKEIVQGKEEAVDALRSELQAAWRMALAFEQELGDTLPNSHRALDANRHRILAAASALMIGSEKPWTELPRLTKIASDILDKDFGTLYGTLVRDVSTGEIARLIGECPVGWEKPASHV